MSYWSETLLMHIGNYNGTPYDGIKSDKVSAFLVLITNRHALIHVNIHMTQKFQKIIQLPTEYLPEVHISIGVWLVHIFTCINAVIACILFCWKRVCKSYLKDLPKASHRHQSQLELSKWKWLLQLYQFQAHNAQE